MDRRFAQPRVARKNRDELDPKTTAHAPGRHDEQRVLGLQRAAHRIVLPVRNLIVLLKCAHQRVDQGFAAEPGGNLWSVELQHAGLS